MCPHSYCREHTTNVFVLHVFCSTTRTTSTTITTDTTTDTKYFVQSVRCLDYAKSPNHLPTESLATVAREVFHSIIQLLIPVPLFHVTD